MMGFLARSIGIIILTACSLAVQADESESPVYQRHRGSEAYGGNTMAWQHPGLYPLFPQFGYGFQQPLSGSWFSRPYPSHLDYHQVRSRMQPVVQACPCTEQQGQ